MTSEMTKTARPHEHPISMHPCQIEYIRTYINRFGFCLGVIPDSTFASFPRDDPRTPPPNCHFGHSPKFIERARTPPLPLRAKKREKNLGLHLRLHAAAAAVRGAAGCGDRGRARPRRRVRAPPSPAARLRRRPTLRRRPSRRLPFRHPPASHPRRCC